RLFSQVIRARDKCCQRCDSVSDLQCAHIFSRRNKSVRWDLDTAVTLCHRHHLSWAHSEPIQFMEWVKKWLGLKRFRELRRRAMTPKIWTPAELITIKKVLKSLL